MPQAELTARLHSPRWGHADTYKFEWTKDGWILHHGGHPRSVGPDGTVSDTNSSRNTVTGVMHNDHIFPPDVLDTALRSLWRGIGEEEMTLEKAQAAMTELETWINEVTRTAPSRNTESAWYGVF